MHTHSFNSSKLEFGGEREKRSLYLSGIKKKRELSEQIICVNREYVYPLINELSSSGLKHSEKLYDDEYANSSDSTFC